MTYRLAKVRRRSWKWKSSTLAVLTAFSKLVRKLPVAHAMYYDSHARFLFAATAKHPLHELRTHLVSLGLPVSRLLEGGT